MIIVMVEVPAKIALLLLQVLPEFPKGLENLQK